MKVIIMIAIIILFRIECYSQTMCSGQVIIPGVSFNVCDDRPWQLVFEDNFENGYLDQTKWLLPFQGVLRDYNFANEKQWYANTGNTPSIPISNNINVQNGNLSLIARKEITPIHGTYITGWSPITYSSSTFDYSSAQVETPYRFGYGKYEVRCKIPSGKGFWPAFWIYGENDISHANNEIDIFEFWDNKSNEGNMTVYYDGGKCGNTKFFGPDYSIDYHTYGLTWENDKIQWFVDGALKRTDYHYIYILGSLVGCEINAYQQYVMNKVFPKDPMAIILNLALQKGNGNDPDASTLFPSELTVDWVKYYKREDCSYDKNITNSIQLLLQQKEYNSVIGQNVEFNTNYTISPNLQLEILGGNSVSLKPGFSSIIGSVCNVKISDNICQVYGKKANNENRSLNVEKEEEIKYTDVIKLYPNPINENYINVDFGSLKSTEFTLKIYNSEGKIIHSENNFEKEVNDLYFTELNKGFYIFSFFNNKSGQVTNFNILKE